MVRSAPRIASSHAGKCSAASQHPNRIAGNRIGARCARERAVSEVDRRRRGSRALVQRVLPIDTPLNAHTALLPARDWRASHAHSLTFAALISVRMSYFIGKSRQGHKPRPPTPNGPGWSHGRGAKLAGSQRNAYPATSPVKGDGCRWAPEPPSAFPTRSGDQSCGHERLGASRSSQAQSSAWPTYG